MALSALQARIAWLALHLPEADGFVLAGGGAMLAHGLVDRPTQDLDLFAREPAHLGPFAAAITRALHAEGLDVHDGRVAPTFRQLIVTDEQETVLVEIAHDARLWPASMLAVGAVLSIRELAADKTLALFGRAEARDLLDVHALAQRYTLAELLDLAAQKDPGFDIAVFARALAAAAACSDGRFSALGLAASDIAALRIWATTWQQSLEGRDDAI